MFLRSDEVKALTGASHKSKQAEWLTRNGFRFFVGVDDEIKILAEHVSFIMNPGARVKSKPAPNFKALENS